MNSPSRHESASSKYRIELAGPADAQALDAIYGSDDGFGGEISVKFSRAPDPRASLLAEADEVVIPVVREIATGRLVGMGACTIRQAWVNGRPETVGYLTGLKALPEYRRGVPLIPQVYAFLRENTRQVHCYYTTILSENLPARKLLERRRPRMPEYRPVGEYVTHFFRTRDQPLSRPHLSSGTVTELTALNTGGTQNLVASGQPPGARDADVRVLRDRDGTALAWCALHDQHATKHYVITGYGGRYQRLSKLPVHWAGYPRLPKVGVPANYLSITGLGAAGGDAGLARRLLRAVAGQNRDRDFLMLGLARGHDFEHALARVRTITYSSQLYTVHFDDDCAGLDGRPIGLDVALL